MSRENVAELHKAMPSQLSPTELDAIDEHLSNANAIADALASQDEQVCVEAPNMIRLANLIHREIEAARKLLSDKA